MPIYEYKCRKCGEKFEEYRGVYESDTEVRCPKCGSQDTERQISSFFGKTDDSSCDTRSFG
jgi:putative FmdB family regulatory protein